MGIPVRSITEAIVTASPPSRRWTKTQVIIWSTTSVPRARTISRWIDLRESDLRHLADRVPQMNCKALISIAVLGSLAVEMRAGTVVLALCRSVSRLILGGFAGRRADGMASRDDTYFMSETYETVVTRFLREDALAIKRGRNRRGGRIDHEYVYQSIDAAQRSPVR